MKINDFNNVLDKADSILEELESEKPTEDKKPEEASPETATKNVEAKAEDEVASEGEDTEGAEIKEEGEIAKVEEPAEKEFNVDATIASEEGAEIGTDENEKHIEAEEKEEPEVKPEDVQLSEDSLEETDRDEQALQNEINKYNPGYDSTTGLPLEHKEEPKSEAKKVLKEFSDYELYKILEDNGYETDEENLNILKESLNDGTLKLVEDEISEDIPVDGQEPQVEKAEDAELEKVKPEDDIPETKVDEQPAENPVAELEKAVEAEPEEVKPEVEELAEEKVVYDYAGSSKERNLYRGYSYNKVGNNDGDLLLAKANGVKGSLGKTIIDLLLAYPTFGVSLLFKEFREKKNKDILASDYHNAIKEIVDEDLEAKAILKKIAIEVKSKHPDNAKLKKLKEQFFKRVSKIKKEYAKGNTDASEEETKKLTESLDLFLESMENDVLEEEACEMGCPAEGTKEVKAKAEDEVASEGTDIETAGAAPAIKAKAEKEEANSGEDVGEVLVKECIEDLEETISYISDLSDSDADALFEDLYNNDPEYADLLMETLNNIDEDGNILTETIFNKIAHKFRDISAGRKYYANSHDINRVGVHLADKQKILEKGEKCSKKIADERKQANKKAAAKASKWQADDERLAALRSRNTDDYRRRLDNDNNTIRDADIQAQKAKKKEADINKRAYKKNEEYKIKSKDNDVKQFAKDHTLAESSDFKLMQWLDKNGYEPSMENVKLLRESKELSTVSKLPEEKNLEKEFKDVYPSDEHKEAEDLKPVEIKEEAEPTEVKAEAVTKEVEKKQEEETAAEGEEVTPVEVKESVKYKSLKEACLLDADYFSTDSYIKESADEKVEKLTEQVALLMAREAMDPMYDELVKTAVKAQRLQEALSAKYGTIASERVNIITEAAKYTK